MITLSSAFILALLAATGPTTASQSAAPACQTAAVAPGLEGAELVFADCLADCTQGADVFCSGTTCNAVNQNCPAGVRGYVECDGNRTYCPECQGCQALAVCTQGPNVSCTGGSNCSAVDQNCPFQQGYVNCDGNYTFCGTCPCTHFQCKQGCSCPGGISICVDINTCECDCVYQ